MTNAIHGFFQRRRALFLVLLALVSVAAAWAGYRYLHKPPHYKGVSRIQIDMRDPDMVLATRNLAELPKDIAAAPTLQGLVDVQLVFHYEEDEARLSLEGSVRRLAYEHKLTLQDRFLSTLLSAPAEIGIWRSSKGRPEYFVAAIDRGALAALTQSFAKIALSDGQLKQVGTFSVAGESLPLYTLDYGGGRYLAFVGAGNRWIFMSDPSLALDGENKLTADAAEVLGALMRGKHPWQDKLPCAAQAKHSFVIGRKALTLDYSRFLPALDGLRINFDGTKWHPELRVNHKAFPKNYDLNAKLSALWRTLPADSALCAALPVNWSLAKDPLKELLQDESGLQPTLDALGPVGAICWFAGSRLSAPLFVAIADRPFPPETSKIIANLAAKSWAAAGSLQTEGQGERYVAAVPSRHGMRHEGSQDRSFEPSLARHGDMLIFSPDRSHVDATLAVAAKRAAALGDGAGMQGPIWLVYDPKRLAQLTRSEVQEVLPTDEEPFFREVARNRLWPRLESWGQKQSATAWVGANVSTDGFVALESKPVNGRGNMAP